MDLFDTLSLHNMSNSANNGETMSYDDEISSHLLLDFELAFRVLAYILVAIGVVGNSVIIISGWRLPIIRKKSVTSGSRYYIMNLAVADLGVMFVALITNLVFARRSWTLGSFMCKVLLPLRDVFMLVSLASIPVLSLERYWLITKPLQHVPNKKVAKFVIFFIWLLSYLVNGVPLLLITRVREDTGDMKHCKYEWSSETLMKAHVCFGIALLLTTFMIVAFCYIAIAQTLKAIYRRRSAMNEGYDSEGNKHAITMILRSKRLVKMLIVLVVTFSLCTLPGACYALAHVVHHVTFKNQEVLYAFFHSTMIAGNALNPVILLIMASEYRLCVTEFLKLVRKWKERCCTCVLYKKELTADQPYHEILHDKHQPSTPV